MMEYFILKSECGVIDFPIKWKKYGKETTFRGKSEPNEKND